MLKHTPLHFNNNQHLKGEIEGVKLIFRFQLKKMMYELIFQQV